MIAAAALRRAIAATALFAAGGLTSLLFGPAPLAAKLPNAVFYAVLVLNTFFSVRFFNALPPQDRDERLIDGLLVVLYAALAAVMGMPVLFAAAATLMFVAAVAKYALLFPVMTRHDILRRKIVIDGLGVAFSAATLVATLLFDAIAVAWVQAALFIVANVYWLAINPMYADPLSVRPQ